MSGGRFTFDMERFIVQRTGAEATRKRQLGGDIKDRRKGSLERPFSAFEMVSNPHQSSEYRQQQPFRRLVRDIYSSIPNVPLVVIGLVACILNGTMTPVFSFLLSRLLFEVSTGASNVSAIKFGAIVLGAAALDGLLFGLKYFIMETASNAWVSRV